MLKSGKKGTNIIKMCMDVRCLHLFAADNHGYIYHWDIEGYGMCGKEIEPPTRKKIILLYIKPKKINEKNN